MLIAETFLCSFRCGSKTWNSSPEWFKFYWGSSIRKNVSLLSIYIKQFVYHSLLQEEWLVPLSLKGDVAQSLWRCNVSTVFSTVILAEFTQWQCCCLIYLCSMLRRNPTTANEYCFSKRGRSRGSSITVGFLLFSK